MKKSEVLLLTKQTTATISANNKSKEETDKISLFISFFFVLLIHFYFILFFNIEKKSEEKIVEKIVKIKLQKTLIEEKIIDTENINIKPHNNSENKIQNIENITNIENQKVEKFTDIEQLTNIQNTKIIEESNKTEPKINKETEKKIIKSDKEIKNELSIDKLFESQNIILNEKQKRFLYKEYLNIGEITFKNLFVPNIAKKLKMKGKVVIYFILKPNNIIEDLKFIEKTEYEIINESSKLAIESSYKEYPHTIENTPIIIEFNFN